MAPQNAGMERPAPRCITIIGMAGAGKTTLGRRLARRIDWAHVDGDALIESVYGVPLVRVTDALTKEAFLDVEADVLRGLWAQRCVLSPGGSVVYRDEAMQHLCGLGPVIHLQVGLPLIIERIARFPDRGLAIAPGQTVEDLYREREALYVRYANFTLDADDLSPDECAERAASWLAVEGYDLEAY